MTTKKDPIAPNYPFIRHGENTASITLFPKLIQKFGFTVASIFGKIFDFTQAYEKALLKSKKKQKNDLMILIDNTFCNDFDPHHPFLSTVIQLNLDHAQGFFYAENGRVWMCMSYQVWANHFWNAFSVSTIRRSLYELIKHGLINTTNNHMAASTQVLAFSINVEILQSILEENNPAADNNPSP